MFLLQGLRKSVQFAQNKAFLTKKTATNTCTTCRETTQGRYNNHTRCRFPLPFGFWKRFPVSPNFYFGHQKGDSTLSTKICHGTMELEKGGSCDYWH